MGAENRTILITGTSNQNRSSRLPVRVVFINDSSKTPSTGCVTWKEKLDFEPSTHDREGKEIYFIEPTRPLVLSPVSVLRHGVGGAVAFWPLGLRIADSHRVRDCAALAALAIIWRTWISPKQPGSGSGHRGLALPARPSQRPHATL